ncbi:hypothetical protein COE80_19560 [Bacillus pseudomycoides]|uniref:recombinase family protein n=1 Tax=Bacillus pseudomycoides TaxID=64104 RepID=UPI000BFC98C8|nr:recombinase family protein [Bacillus pseudomycoides]PHB23112.1 hypothetical protein COE80_19560 [Bacillus pseudomycoides]PHE37641.1 hypothetical protein COF51_16525 [Bacillus pseudomycoides]
MKDKLNKIKNVAIYLRKSRKSDGLNVEESLKAHRDTLVRLANKYKWNYTIYEEVGSSMDMAIREELQRMLLEVERGIYDAVVVMDQDRLSRNRYDSAVIKKILLDTYTFIVTAEEECIDLRDASDSLMTDFKDIIASYEYRQTSKRLVRGKDASARKGNWAAGRVPLGYKYNRDTKKLDLEESEARIVREIYKLYLEGEGIREIAIKLNKAGYRSKTSKLFGNKGIWDILKNPIYKGIVRQRHYAFESKSHQYLRDESEWIVHKDIYPRIVSPEEWEEVRKLAEKRSRLPYKARARKHGLTGLITCGYCGQKHGIQWRAQKTKPYRTIKTCWKRSLETGELCRNKGLRYDEVLEYIISKISERRSIIREEISKISSDVSEFTKKKEEQKVKLKEELERVEKQLSRLNYMFINEILSEEEILKEKPPRMAEKEEIERKLFELEGETQESNVSELKFNLKSLERIIRDYRELPDKDLNDLLSNVITNVELFNYNGKDLEPRISIEFK